jgi:hypothetical protein
MDRSRPNAGTRKSRRLMLGNKATRHVSFVRQSGLRRNRADAQRDLRLAGDVSSISFLRQRWKLRDFARHSCKA